MMLIVPSLPFHSLSGGASRVCTYKTLMAVRTSASFTVTYCSGLHSAASSSAYAPCAGRLRFKAEINPASFPKAMSAALFSELCGGESSSGAAAASFVGQGRPMGAGFTPVLAVAASEAALAAHKLVSFVPAFCFLSPMRAFLGGILVTQGFIGSATTALQTTGLRR